MNSFPQPGLTDFFSLTLHYNNLMAVLFFCWPSDSVSGSFKTFETHSHFYQSPVYKSSYINCFWNSFLNSRSNHHICVHCLFYVDLQYKWICFCSLFSTLHHTCRVLLKVSSCWTGAPEPGGLSDIKERHMICHCSFLALLDVCRNTDSEGRQLLLYWLTHTSGHSGFNIWSLKVHFDDGYIWLYLPFWALMVFPSGLTSLH